MLSHTIIHREYPTLTGNDIDLYYCISEKIENNYQKSTQYPIRELVELLQLSERSIERSLRKLADEGLLIIKKVGRNNTYALANDKKDPEKSDTVDGYPDKHLPKTPAKNNGYSKKYPSKMADIKDSNISLKDTHIRLSDNQIHPVYRQYNRLQKWNGCIYRGRTAIQADELKARMAAITPEILQRISDVYDRSQIEHPTAWIQSALLNPWPTITNPQPPKQVHSASRNKFHNFSEREYDFEVLEQQLLTNPVKPRPRPAC